MASNIWPNSVVRMLDYETLCCLQSLEDGKAARSEMEAALGSLQEAVADNSS